MQIFHVQNRHIYIKLTSFVLPQNLTQKVFLPFGRTYTYSYYRDIRKVFIPHFKFAKIRFLLPPFENINETLKTDNTKFNAAKELVFVSIAKKFAALMYN